jgi:hypothetical protein
MVTDTVVSPKSVSYKVFGAVGPAADGMTTVDFGDHRERSGRHE